MSTQNTFVQTVGQVWKALQGYVLWVVLPLAIGVWLALQVPQPAIGVVTIDMPILSFTTSLYNDQLAYIREHPEVRAVVLAINCPGGTVVGTEEIYQDIQKIRVDRPVIAVVEGMAASGGYYIATASDHIYTSSSAEVGNIGVIAQLPPSALVVEDTIWTGPYKTFGYSPDSLVRQAEMLKNQFYEAVRVGRGDALNASKDIVLSGNVWSGTTAYQLGLVDDLGTRSTAIEHAAREAKIANYQVLDVQNAVQPPNMFFIPLFGKKVEQKVDYRPTEPGLYFWYVSPGERINQ